MMKNILTKFQYKGKIYYSTNDNSENLYNEDGTIYGKAYEPKCAIIISNGEIIK